MTEHQAPALPAVRPEVVAEVVAALSPRLQKRLDGAAAKLAGRPLNSDGDDWTIEVDEDVRLTLHAPGGVVRTAAGIVCGCLLAPACLHRAAAATAMPLDTGAMAESAAESAAGSVSGPEAQPAPEPAGVAVTPLSADERAAAERLHHCASAVLAAGVGGAGAVLQAELLRAAHQARLSGLHRPAAGAVAVVTRLRAARSGEPDHRLAELAAALRDLLALVTALCVPATADHALGELRGTARQTYEDVGGLRLYGLFAEPVLTATHAGVLTWAVDATGRLSTVAEITPHTDPATAAPQSLAAANRAVRLGDTMLSHRELTRAGLSVQGATRSAGGRLGAGAKVHAVRAAGASWTAEPAARLWAEPVAGQVARALAWAELPYDSRPAGGDLLFLDVTLLGAGWPEDAAAPQVRADCDGLPLALLPAHDHPDLAHRANLALLAGHPGLRLRVIGRLDRSSRARLRLLAVGTATDEPSATLALAADRAGRVSLGLERLQRADLPPASLVSDPGPAPAEAPAFDPPAFEAPVHLLTRRVEQAVTGGRRALALTTPDAAAQDRRRLAAAGLATAALLLAGLRATATDQQRDVFGRVLADDHRAFTDAWLAAACYGEELAAALCTAAWSRPDTG
ncbi:hypothetical protein [Kitasatospora sp. NPDC057223]|uniref:hypothetical protein n=1 Tax=Kitasatospora sp. NPDC057223 TaxID=3346055 RepID=UPI00363C5A56